MTWKEYFKKTRNRAEALLTVVSLIVVLSVLAHFLNFIESRNGVVLPDPLLNLFAPVDLTWLIFGIIYFSIFYTVYLLISKPGVLMLTIQAYILVVIIRMMVMYVVPFNPPAGMIRLDDPFVQFFGTGKLLTKDLFFSGHTAIVFLFYLVAEGKTNKRIFLIFTITVAISVLLQHVHYTVDVAAAPFFTYGCYVITKKLRKKIGLGFA